MSQATTEQAGIDATAIRAAIDRVHTAMSMAEIVPDWPLAESHTDPSTGVTTLTVNGWDQWVTLTIAPVPLDQRHP